MWIIMSSTCNIYIYKHIYFLFFLNTQIEIECHSIVARIHFTSFKPLPVYFYSVKFWSFQIQGFKQKQKQKHFVLFISLHVQTMVASRDCSIPHGKKRRTINPHDSKKNHKILMCKMETCFNSIVIKPGSRVDPVKRSGPRFYGSTRKN